jgi:hypothetical protein
MRNRLGFEKKNLGGKCHLLIILEVEHLLVNRSMAPSIELPAEYAICQVD